MTTGSDLDSGSDRLSPTARRMLALRDDVLMEWSNRLRATVKEAEHLPHPILINTFPALYDNLVQAISPDFPRVTATENDSVAFEHGGERARLTNYDVEAVIVEYQLLRWSIFDVLKRNGVQLDNDELFIVNKSIDEAIRQSANAFAAAQSALRERFVAALTHDLRSPLASASAAAELIRMSTDSPRITELAERISVNLSRMDRMIRDLLDAMVFQSGERLRLQIEEFDMLAVAKEVCDQLNAIHGPRFQLSGITVIGRWDRAAIKRAIENLAGNAVKYGSSDTPVKIRVDTLHERTILKVHNEGNPIPPEQHGFVFQIFRRPAAATEDGSRGWGIGLPYVRAVVESHGGSISLDSAPDRGTTFTIDIPVDARPYQKAPTFGHKTD